MGDGSIYRIFFVMIGALGISPAVSEAHSKKCRADEAIRALFTSGRVWNPGLDVPFTIDQKGQNLVKHFPERANARSLTEAVTVSYEDGKIIKRVYDSRGVPVDFAPVVFDSRGARVAPEAVTFKRENGKYFAIYKDAQTGEVVKLEPGERFRMVQFKVDPKAGRQTIYYDESEKRLVTLSSDQHQHVVENRPQNFQIYRQEDLKLKFKDSLFENGISDVGNRTAANRSSNLGLDRHDFLSLVNSPLIKKLETDLYQAVRQKLGLDAGYAIDMTQPRIRQAFYEEAVALASQRFMVAHAVDETGVLRSILEGKRATPKHLAALTHVLLARQGIPSQLASYPGKFGVATIVKVEDFAIDFGVQRGVHRYTNYRDQALFHLPEGRQKELYRDRLENSEQYVELEGSAAGIRLEQ